MATNLETSTKSVIITHININVVTNQIINILSIIYQIKIILNIVES